MPSHPDPKGIKIDNRSVDEDDGRHSRGQESIRASSSRSTDVDAQAIVGIPATEGRSNPTANAPSSFQSGATRASKVAALAGGVLPGYKDQVRSSALRRQHNEEQEPEPSIPEPSIPLAEGVLIDNQDGGDDAHYYPDAGPAAHLLVAPQPQCRAPPSTDPTRTDLTGYGTATISSRHRVVENQIVLRKHIIWAVAVVVLGTIVAVVVSVMLSGNSSNNNYDDGGLSSGTETEPSTPSISPPPDIVGPSMTQSPTMTPSNLFSTQDSTSTPSAAPSVNTGQETKSPTSLEPTALAPTSLEPTTVAPTAPPPTTMMPTEIGRTVGPTEFKLVARSGAANHNFGYDVAIDSNSDTVVVGARFDTAQGDDSGSAFVYGKTANTGDWTEQAKLLASDGTAGGAFGYSVAISGNTIVIGAAQYDNVRGAAYIFDRMDESTWSEQAKLTAVDGVQGDEFGRNVVIDGDRVVVGARYDDDQGLDSGVVFVFQRQESNTATAKWTQQAKLLTSDGTDGDGFGFGLAIQGDTIVAGAYSDNDNQGAAYVFGITSDAGVPWTEQAKLTASDGGIGDEFGISVAIDNGTIVVGAWRSDSNGRGAFAYVFGQSGSSWLEEAKLSTTNGSTGDSFGRSVSISGGMIIVGAYQDIENGMDSGAAYIFESSGDTWSETSKLTPSDNQDEQRFGFSVASSQNTIAVGAYWDTDNGRNSGSAYIFDPKQF